MRLYLAGPSLEMYRVREVLVWLRRVPALRVVSEWHNADTFGRDASFARFDRQNIADACRSQIRASDCVWLLHSPLRSFGSAYELGFADALDKPVIISGPSCSDTIFSESPRRQTRVVDSDRLAFDWLVEAAGEQTKPMARVSMQNAAGAR